MATITPTEPTFLKLSSMQAGQLPANQKRFRAAGDPLRIRSVELGEDDHWRVHFAPPGLTIGDGPVLSCLIWPKHWEGVDEVFAKVQVLNHALALEQATPRTDAAEVKLPVAYKSQMDNRLNPTGACNVTCLAMGMEYFQISGKFAGDQLEDELYREMERLNLSRHSPEGLRQMAEIYGMRDRFTAFAKPEEIKTWIRSGRPCIFHGWFTDFGHIVMAVGFDETGFWIHDPYGEWTSGGYLRNSKQNQRQGEYVHYSYGLVLEKCKEGDGSFWCHFLDGPLPPPPLAAAPLRAAKQPQGLSTVTVMAARTFLKQDWTKQAVALPANQVHELAQGESFACVVNHDPKQNGHVILTLPDHQKLFGADVWYGFAKHLKIETAGGISLLSAGATITQADIFAAAAAIKVEPAAMQAVLEVEAAGAGFLPSGRCKILYEAAWFGQFTDDRYSDSHPTLSTRTWNRSLYKGGELEWGRLEAARRLADEPALKSASWGLGQVMGFHWKSLGYASVHDFVDRMGRSEGEQLMAMAKFIETDPRLLRALQQLSWADFAYGYNGEGYALNEYDKRLAEAYAAIS
jgi:uncharacterized protein YvpB